MRLGRSQGIDEIQRSFSSTTDGKATMDALLKDYDNDHFRSSLREWASSIGYAATFSDLISGACYGRTRSKLELTPLK